MKNIVVLPSSWSKITNIVFLSPQAKLTDKIRRGVLNLVVVAVQVSWVTEHTVRPGNSCIQLLYPFIWRFSEAFVGERRGKETPIPLFHLQRLSCRFWLVWFLLGPIHNHFFQTNWLGTMNAPPTFESFLLFDEKKITKEQDTKVPNAAIFTINKEDHTLGRIFCSF